MRGRVLKGAAPDPTPAPPTRDLLEIPVPPRTRTRRIAADHVTHAARVERADGGLLANVRLHDGRSAKDRSEDGAAPSLILELTGDPAEVLAVLTHAADELRVQVRAEVEALAAEAEALRKRYAPDDLERMLAPFLPTPPATGGAGGKQAPVADEGQGGAP